MKKMLKRLCTGFLALATVVTALPTTPVHAESKQYWTESAERVGIIEKVMNDGSIGSTFNEGYMKVEGETAYCIDINTDFKNGYKTRADASSRMSADQISDVALSLEYVKQYGEAHKELNYNVKATYTVKVHVDADGDMVIVQNPTLAPAIEKSDYEPKTPEADASIDADTVNDATAFLETFFKLYPTATEKELAYYVTGNVLEPIGRDYLYSELVNPIFTKDGDNVKVKVAVKFLDNQTKATQVSQYELVLHKDSNWKIIK